MFSTMLLVCYLHAKINTLALQWQLLWIYTYVKITSCWYQMYVELLGDYVFSLMHLYKCMNVMFIVPIKHKGRSRPALTRVTAPLSKGWVGVRGFSRPAWEVFSYSMLRGFFPSQADFFCNVYCSDIFSVTIYNFLWILSTMATILQSIKFITDFVWKQNCRWGKWALFTTSNYDF